MSYALNADVGAVNPPPIADVHRWMDGIDPTSLGGLLDVAQAVPVEPPAPALLEHTAEAMRQSGLHRYTPIRGLTELCDALADHMNGVYAGDVDSTETVITNGCNQAFCSVMRALARSGDEVILPVPYYFNHQMWLDMLGIGAVHVPFEPEHGGVPSIEAFERAITSRTRAIVVVTPNNPTGAVYPDALLEALFDLANAHHIALVMDETYKDYHPTPRRPHSLFMRANWRETLVQLFSFSKSYALAGYRVGSVVAGDGLVRQVTKVQDCISICAAQVSQVAALYALRNLADDVRVRADTMATCVSALRSAVAGGEHGFELVAAGAWFAYLRHPFAGVDGYRVARAMARQLGILSIPGSVFGPDQEPFIRFAFANLRSEDAGPLAQRLARVRDLAL